MWIYFRDLDTSVTDSQLYDFCKNKNQTEVISIQMERDSTTKRSLGYGYIYYENREKALRALEVLKVTPLNGTPIRVMCEDGPGTIFIKNLDKAIDRQALHDTFSSFGNILSCKVATDPSGESRGYGSVQYDSEEAAQKAIERLNGMLLKDKQVYVGPFLQKQEREMALDKVKFTNVFVKNLSESTTEEDLKEIFGDFGAITSSVLMRDADGNSKCFGFVNFANADDAARSVESLNGRKTDNKAWFVGKAQKKSERELELKNRFEQTAKEAADKSQGLNLYIKNLDDSIGDDKLKELFSPFGIITSYKVMRDPSGVSRGSGFVAFSTPEEASRALLEMNGKMIVSKPLYVAQAQRKEDRRARLQAQFCPVVMAPSVAPRMPMYPPGGPGLGQQIFYGQAPPAIIPPRMLGDNLYPLVEQLEPEMAAKVTGMLLEMDQTEVLHLLESPEALTAKVAEAMEVLKNVQQQQASNPADQLQGQYPGGRHAGGVPVQQGQQPVPLMQQQAQFPLYPSGGSGLGQQMFRGQAPPAVTPPQQLVPGTRPGQLPIPNFFVPLVQQGQHPGGRHAGGVPVQQCQQPVPLMQQQMLPRGQIYHYPTGRGLPDVSMSGVAQGMLSIPYHIIGGMPLRDGRISQPTPIGSLASALSNFSPADQRTMLG